MALRLSAVCLRSVSVLVSAVDITVNLVAEVIGVSLLSSLVLWSTRFLRWSASVVVLAVTALVVALVVALARCGTGIVGARLGLVVTRAPVGVSWFVVWRL